MNFPCNFCQRTFTKESDRNKHERRQHKHEIEKKSSSDLSKDIFKVGERGDNSVLSKFKYGEQNTNGPKEKQPRASSIPNENMISIVNPFKGKKVFDKSDHEEKKDLINAGTKTPKVKRGFADGLIDGVRKTVKIKRSTNDAEKHHNSSPKGG